MERKRVEHKNTFKKLNLSQQDKNDIYQKSKRLCSISAKLSINEAIKYEPFDYHKKVLNFKSEAKKSGKTLDEHYEQQVFKSVAETLSQQPIYYHSRRLAGVKEIDRLSESGFINVLMRKLKLEPPSGVQNKYHDGTIEAYYRTYKKSGKQYDEKMKLNTGDLLIWKPSGSKNLGHIGFYEKEDYIWHCIPYDNVCKSRLSDTIRLNGNKFLVVPRTYWLHFY